MTSSPYTKVVEDLLADPLLYSPSHPSLNNLSILNLNINGLPNKNKLDSVSNLSKILACDLMILTETHLKSEHRKKVERKLPNSIFTLYRKAKRGVLVWSTSKDMKITEVTRDSKSRILMTDVECKEKKFTLVAIYAPAVRTKRKPFFRETLPPFLCMAKHPLILVGDFNTKPEKIDRKLLN